MPQNFPRLAEKGRRRMTAFQQRAGRGLVSAIIVVILGTQFVAGLVDTGKWGWPILAYPMYKWSHYENERILHDADVYAQLDDGSRIAITPEALGMSFWIFFTTSFLRFVTRIGPSSDR
jgi:hypothetical protein